MRCSRGTTLSLPWMALFNLLRPEWRNFVALAAWQLSPLLLYLQHPNIPLGNHPSQTFRTFISYAVDSTLGSCQANFKDYLKDERMIQQKANENHAQSFGSNSWPQVILPMQGKRPFENGASLKESRVERCKRPGLQTVREPWDPGWSKLRMSLGFPAPDHNKFPFCFSILDLVFPPS